ncbi:lipoprotein insertase outer membrane protein LolB [Methylophaga sp.]|uniref:lipoprotein insertase outer membrane protein LolB n=1 Tax=Methylophaga sp. TaxID=2024840 RepID=UPI003F6A0156
MKKLLLLGLLVLVSGCAPVWQQKTTESPDALWQQRLTQQEQLNNWAFKGRTAITQGNEGWNAGIRWEEQDQDFYIKLYGPFSQGGVELKGDKHEVTLTLDDGETMTAATPEQLLVETIGWLLPVSALRDWVRGVPYSKVEVDHKQLDEKGRLTLLEQGGWTIEFLRYMPFETYSMPSKVFIKHPDLSVRLVVSDWSRPK